ncbi:hypothetical protein Nepgr_033128 [Nepenthes gracilis]|uniref:Pentatricopeptide repeat-containing protein n=1 Tax=Nepenthes gracilis TaxID=150966 RepID=A0AAD3TKN3_NEPGR|nr:hypothetical protein Nepgr_033128 [Nepenthes gracilis]
MVFCDYTSVMARFACRVPCDPYPFHASSDNLAQTTRSQLFGHSLPPKLRKLGTRKIHTLSTLAVADVGGMGNVEIEAKVRPKFRWVEIGIDSMTEEQKLAIYQLPRKMTKRCKALMKQIICFSPQKGSLSDLLAAWVRIMKPRRADWLAVLKELRLMDHPLFIEVAELALLEESFETNVRDYTKMIHTYARQNRLGDAEDAFAAMNRRGMICDQVTLTAMIHMYSKAGKFKLAEETFLELKLISPSLDKRSYGSMIMAYIRAGMPDQGENLLREMEEHEIYAGREVYKALLRAYSMSGDFEGAQRVFNAIQFAGINPDAKFCALLVNAFVVAGQIEKAQAALENTIRAGVEPSDKCVALLLAALEKGNELNAALEFLLGLERDGVVIGKEASELLVWWFRRLGVVEEVAVVLREFATEKVACPGPRSK